MEACSHHARALQQWQHAIQRGVTRFEVAGDRMTQAFRGQPQEDPSARGAVMAEQVSNRLAEQIGFGARFYRTAELDDPVLDSYT